MTNAESYMKTAQALLREGRLSAWEARFIQDLEANFPNKKALRGLSKSQFVKLREIASK